MQSNKISEIVDLISIFNFIKNTASNSSTLDRGLARKLSPLVLQLEKEISSKIITALISQTSVDGAQEDTNPKDAEKVEGDEIKAKSKNANKK